MVPSDTASLCARVRREGARARVIHWRHRVRGPCEAGAEGFAPDGKSRSAFQRRD